MGEHIIELKNIYKKFDDQHAKAAVLTNIN